MAQDARGPKVTFVHPGETIEVRLIDSSIESIIDVANTLDARYYVMEHEYVGISDSHTYAVFDTQRQGKKAVDLLVKTFPNKDAAVMWALAMKDA